MSDDLLPPQEPPAPKVLPLALEYATPTPPAVQTVEWQQIWPTFMLLLSSLGLLSSIVPLDSDDVIVSVFVFLWLPTTLGAVIRLVKSRAGTGAPPTKGKRAVCVITCWLSLATLVLSVRYYQCPHARYYGIGPFTMTKGRPCSNARKYDNLVTLIFRH